MEHWEARAEFYASRGRKEDQAFEDMLGRRILKGLGCSEKQIYQLERFVFAQDSGEDPLWHRASKLFLALLARQPQWSYLAQQWYLEAMKVGKNKDKEAVELLEQFGGGMKKPVVFTVPKANADRVCTAFSLWPLDSELVLLNPPYRVVTHIAELELAVVAQEAAHFVTQFGPYEHMEHA